MGTFSIIVLGKDKDLKSKILKDGFYLDDNHLQSTPPNSLTSRTEECPNHRSVPKYEKKLGNKEERYIYYRGWYLKSSKILFSPDLDLVS